MKHSIEYTETITDQCDEVVFEFRLEETGFRITDAHGRSVSLERHEFDQLIAAVAKYDAMVAIATPKGSDNER